MFFRMCEYCVFGLYYNAAAVKVQDFDAKSFRQNLFHPAFPFATASTETRFILLSRFRRAGKAPARSNRTRLVLFCAKATPHNPSSAPSGKFVLWFCHFFLKYTKYSCEKLPSSEPKFSQNSLSPNYAVLP